MSVASASKKAKYMTTDYRNTCEPSIRQTEGSAHNRHTQPKADGQAGAARTERDAPCGMADLYLPFVLRRDARPLDTNPGEMSSESRGA